MTFNGTFLTRRIRMGKVDPDPALFPFGQIGELRTVVTGDGFENFRIFVTEL